MGNNTETKLAPPQPCLGCHKREFGVSQHTRLNAEAKEEHCLVPGSLVHVQLPSYSAKAQPACLEITGQVPDINHPSRQALTDMATGKLDLSNSSTEAPSSRVTLGCQCDNKS